MTSYKAASIRTYRPGPAGARLVFSGARGSLLLHESPIQSGSRVFLLETAGADSALRQGYPCGPLPVFRLAGFLSGWSIYGISDETGQIPEQESPRSSRYRYRRKLSMPFLPLMAASSGAPEHSYANPSASCHAQSEGATGGDRSTASSRLG